MWMSCCLVVPSALYQSHTSAVYNLHRVTNTLKSAAIAYSAQPPPTVEEIEAAKKEILKLKNGFHYRNSPETYKTSVQQR